MVKENSGFISFSGNTYGRRNPFVMRLALVLSTIALIIISFIALTVFSSNRLMNINRNEVTNVPSNILPSYNTTSFQSADGQTSLQGWFFKTKNPISTIIVVHDAGSNRLPFGVEMIDISRAGSKTDIMFSCLTSGIPVHPAVIYAHTDILNGRMCWARSP